MFLVTFWFLVFLAVSIAAYYAAPGRCRWVVLLLASFVFYMLAGTPFTVVYLLVTIVTVWAGSNYIDRVRGDAKKARRALLATLLVNVGILAALKYTNFFLENFRRISGLFGVGAGIQNVHWAASLGVSFYTLQAVGYLLDVYWGTSSPQKNVFKFALFTSWFPQMSSGPISRYHELEGQLFAANRFSYERVCAGLQRVLFGFVKKLVVAENIGIYVNYLFAEEASFNGWFIWLGMAAYLLQLYADFSGCMDIVLGASECFGVLMPENFDRPFHSHSIQEFWKRWHITLGGWVQDYIMYPILHSKAWGRMRRSLKKKFGKAAAKNVPTYLAMLILWLCMGLWHGGAWRYIVEMVWFWLVIMTGQLLEKRLKRLTAGLHINTGSPLWHGFQSIRTTLIFGLGVTFFRASSVSQGLHYLKAAFSPKCLMPGNFRAQLGVFLGAFSRTELLKSLVCIVAGLLVMVVLTWFSAKGRPFREWLAARCLVVRWGILYAMLFIVILFGVYGPGFNASQFIYGGF